jgi:CheY-like chemotaxis protein
VEPRDGGGSVFRFTIDSESATGTAPDRPPLAGLRLLAIVPDGAEAPVVGRMLGAAGADARVVATVNAGAALLGAAAAANLPYDAVLVDRRLATEPEAVLALLRDAAGTRVPAIALVEATERASADGLQGSGFDGCLVRPVRRASLLAVVRSAVSATGTFHPDPHGLAVPEAPRRARPAAGGPVLLAEDNEISALLARAVIESLGHAVTDVRDGNAAVAAATAGRYDAVFLDLHMPGCDGLAAAARIRTHEQATGRPPVPIIALTADALPETRRAALAAGIDSLLEKPVAPETLRAALAAALDRRDAA